MITNQQSINQLLRWLIIKTKGGKNRAQIIKILKENPQNTNQIATFLKLDYKTISHHLAVLEKNKLIISIGDQYSIAYCLSEQMEENYPLFEEITSKTNDTKKRTITFTNNKRAPPIVHAMKKIKT
jgi:predicted transcriptional regulator